MEKEKEVARKEIKIKRECMEEKENEKEYEREKKKVRLKKRLKNKRVQTKVTNVLTNQHFELHYIPNERRFRIWERGKFESANSLQMLK
ncbi:hypothetical protein J1N35_044026, partial [Gossypium stocksii]